MKSASLIRIASFLALLAPAAAARTGESLAEFLARARAANGVESFRAGGRDLLIHGTMSQFGVAGPYTDREAPDGRFARAVTGRLALHQGFDGHETWNVDTTGMPQTWELSQREHLLFDEAMRDGSWCLEDGPLVVEEGNPSADPALRTLDVRLKGGLLAVDLDVDAASALPKTARAKPAGELETWSWSDWSAAAAGRPRVPGKVRFEDGAIVFEWTIAGAEPADRAADAAFARPTARPTDTHFDPAIPARLPGRHARTGHLMIKGAFAGAPPGYLAFDSGAGVSVISPRVVDALKLERFGSSEVGGGGAGRVKTDFVRGGTLTLGPVTVKDLVWSEIDLSTLDAAIGEKMDGIVGYDLLMRTVAVVDMKDATVDLFDPASFQRAGVSWTPLVLHGNHPQVRARFDLNGEDEGIFRLDTGAPGATVLFHSPAARALGLLDGPEPAPLPGGAAVAGIGGRVHTRPAALDVFEIGGRTYDHLKILACSDDVGAMADPWSTGTLGGDVLGDFDVIFDYPHRRVGFVAHTH